MVDPNAINIFDYMEDYENPYLVPKYISQIHSKLKDGIALIALQKPGNRDFGQGGAGTQNKSRLYLAIDFETIKIVKAKNKKRGIDANGMMIRYNLEDSVHYVALSGWYKPETKNEPF